MRYIEWNLDIEEGANLYDPIGNMKISGDEGDLAEEYTYLDAFFEAFVEGIERMKLEDVVRVDPLIESNDIVFYCKGSLLKIQYGTQQTTILNKLQFIEEIQKAVIDLVKILDEFAEKSKQPKRSLIKLRAFSQRLI
ncbi:MAG: hypothetical protein WCP16_19075 [Pseudanabaena sp. ELA645]|jgi:hypothetical protein